MIGLGLLKRKKLNPMMKKLNIITTFNILNINSLFKGLHPSLTSILPSSLHSFLLLLASHNVHFLSSVSRRLLYS